MPVPARRRELTYNVRVWGIRKVSGKKSTSHEVRWRVGTRPRSRKFRTYALADSFRADLLSAARRGEGFDVSTGLPESMQPVDRGPSWWEWCLTYTELKWPTLAPGSRRGVAEALTTVTAALVDGRPGAPDGKQLRTAMMRWAFNMPARHNDPPEELASALAWLARHSPALADLADAAVTRRVLDALARKIDGSPVAASTVARKRAIFHNALELAVEREHLAVNPLARIRWSAPKVNEVLDMRTVVNHEQARRLLAAVAAQSDPIKEEDGTVRMPSDIGLRLVAFFGCIYYAALRPGEVVELRVANLRLPAEGWGEIVFSESNPDVSPAWSDDGKRSARELKHRARGAARTVPCAPPLVELLQDHLRRFPPPEGGRIFRGRYGGIITENTYSRVWQRARMAALTPAEAASPLARRPYDLRHAAVSTWLAAGVESTLVAVWAGHSVQVLHRVYAQVVRGREKVALKRIEALFDMEVE
jgi:integrase